MEHISKTLEAGRRESATNSSKSQQKTSQKTAFPKAWVSALFIKFQARYGAKWTASIEGIEDEATSEWALQLSGLTGEDIARGLAAWSDEWPPSAPEFKKACRQYVTAAHRPFDKSKALEHKPDPEKAKEAIDEMRRRLKGG